MLLINISKYSVTADEIIRSLKISIMIRYFMLIILITTVLSTESRSDKTSTSNNSIGCYHNFKKDGNLSLQFKEECNNYYINIDFELKINIINLTMSIREIARVKHLTKSEHYSEEDFILKVDIHETTVHVDERRENISQVVWEENQNHIPIQRNYLSRTSSIYIVISSTGNWSSRYDVTFSFDEIEHSLRIVDNYSVEGNIEDEYLPNSIKLYRLMAENSKKKWAGIEIAVEYLNINKEMGEYLLIGEGTDILKSKDFLPLYVTDITQNSTFYVGNSSAYIVFVSGSVQKIDNKIEISWSREEVKPLPKPKEDPFGVLNSSLICFYNYTAAMQEFDKTEEEQFKLFRQSFAGIVKLHGKDKNIDSLDQTAIKLFGHPTEVHVDTIDSDALSILLKVMYEGKSIFTWNELQKIIEKFEQSDTNLLLGYKVGKCPQENKELPYKDKWSFLIYAIVPLFGFLALMTWAWRQNIFTQKCKPEKEEKLCPEPPIVTEPNPYEMTVPKVCLYDGDCRRGTLIPGSRQPETEETDEEIAVEMNVIPSISRESDTLNRYISSRRSKKRSSIQSLIDQNEETRKQVHTDRTMQMGTESEHLYDSVSNNREMNETQL